MLLAQTDSLLKDAQGIRTRTHCLLTIASKARLRQLLEFDAHIAELAAQALLVWGLTLAGDLVAATGLS